MRLNELKAPRGSRKKRKRIGRGAGSGHGGQATRGHKGQQSRSGGGSHPWFEGGQMPLQRRSPKVGFRPVSKLKSQTVNLDSLEKFAGQGTIAPPVLHQAGLIRNLQLPVKILGRGELKTALTIQAHAYSKSALAKIAAAGGRADIIK